MHSAGMINTLLSSDNVCFVWLVLPRFLFRRHSSANYSIAECVLTTTQLPRTTDRNFPENFSYHFFYFAVCFAKPIPFPRNERNARSYAKQNRAKNHTKRIRNQHTHTNTFNEMDACEIANFLASELFMQQVDILLTFECVFFIVDQCGPSLNVGYEPRHSSSVPLVCPVASSIP